MHRIDAQHREQTRRHRPALHALGARHVAAQHEAADQIRLDAFDAGRGAEIDQVAVRNLGFSPVRFLLRLCRMRRMQRDQPIGSIAKRHRPQAEPVDDAEDRDVGADANRQREERGDEETGLLPEAAPGMQEVAKESAHGARSIKPCATKRSRIQARFSEARSRPFARANLRCPHDGQLYCCVTL